MKHEKLNVKLGPEKVPVIEVDRAALAAYIRFSGEKVCRTENSRGPLPLINVDYDSVDEVIGVEMVGYEKIDLEAEVNALFLNGQEILTKAERRELV